MTNNKRPKTILILAANPTNTAPLRLGEEVREIDEGLRRANKREEFELKQKWAVRSRDFYRGILDYRPQIVHFCGHGAGQDGIVLEDDTGKMALVPTNVLASMFQLFARKGVQCVILNACYSEVQAEAISQYVKYVIGMNRSVGDKAAVAFAVAFYDTLAAGCEVEDAYKLGCSQMMIVLEHETPVLKKRKLTDAAIEQVSLDFEDVIPPNPYQGLAAFKEEDADFFFGQEKFVNNLVAITHKQPFIGIVGPSGSGKSSVVFAGLIPKLREQGNWLIEIIRPGNEPFKNLVYALAQQLEPSSNEFDKLRLESEIREGRITVKQALSRIVANNLDKRLLLVIDQFEELYTLCRVKEEQERFADELLTAITQENITLVFTLRADFYGYMLSYRPFRDALQEYTPQLLSSMKREELQAAIELPAQKLEVDLETQLTQRLLDDVGEEPGNLPLLEFALTRLWQKQAHRELTHQAYEEIGGVKKAIAIHAEQIYQELNEIQKKQAQRIFIQLIRPGEGTEDTRRVATRAEVGEENWNLVSYLAGYKARLVVTGRQEQEDTVEVVHEALIREWGTLRKWMNDNREFRTWQERLKVTLQDWKNNNYEDSGLVRGKSLNAAEDWLQTHPDQLSIQEREFIEKSISRKQLQDLRNNILLVGLVISLFGAIGFSIKTLHNSDILNISTSSQFLLKTNKEFEGLIESLKASHKSKTPFLTTTESRNRVMTNLRQAVYSVQELNRLEKHQDGITSVSFGKDGQILTSSYDKNIILWSKHGELLKNFEKVHDNTIWKATFSPDGNRIASASKDKTVKIWSKQKDGNWVHSLTLNHNHAVRVVKFSPNKQIIASGDDDSNIKFWSLDGKLLNTINANQDKLLSMSFSQDGQILATGGHDGTVKFWRSKDGNFKTKESKTVKSKTVEAETVEAETVELLGTLKAHSKRGVWSLAFSNDGTMLATGGGDATIKLWREEKGSKSSDWIKNLNFYLDEKTLREICDNKLKKSKNGIAFSCLKASIDYVRGISFSPNDKIIAGATWDKKVLLWYWNKPGTTYRTLKGHTNGVWDVNFSSDGKTVASASDDNTVKLWNIEETPQAFGGSDRIILDVSFSPDSQRVASASQCKIVKQRDVNGNSIKKDLIDPNFNQSPDPQCDNRTQRSHNREVKEVVYSPDGQIIATAGKDCTVKLWNSDGSLRTTLIDSFIQSKQEEYCSDKSSHIDSVQGIAFSRDGKMIASASLDKKIKLWNLQDGELLRTFEGHTSAVDKVRFSPDGKTLVSASADNTIILWNKNDPSNYKIFTGHNNRVRDVSFSPNGQIIASASQDQTVKLWSKNGKLLKTLYGHSGEVESVSFSSDGQMIASGGLDHKINIWNHEGVLLNTIDVPNGPVYSVSFSPNNNFLAAGIDDGQLRLWNIELNKLQEKACNQVRDYLQHNPNVEQANRHLCDQVKHSLIEKIEVEKP